MMKPPPYGAAVFGLETAVGGENHKDCSPRGGRRHKWIKNFWFLWDAFAFQIVYMAEKRSSMGAAPIPSVHHEQKKKYFLINYSKNVKKYILSALFVQ